MLPHFRHFAQSFFLIMQPHQAVFLANNAATLVEFLADNAATPMEFPADNAATPMEFLADNADTPVEFLADSSRLLQWSFLLIMQPHQWSMRPHQWSF